MSKPPLKLYRGDKRKRATMAELYRSEGLFSKGIDGGDPAYINKHGLQDSIRAHINPVSAYDHLFYKKTEFLSFSSNYNTALKYASDNNPEKIIFCQEYTERRYVFTLNISSMDPVDKSNGLYRLDFKCNRKLIRPNAPSDWIIHLLQNYPCTYCGTNKTFHSIILVDVVTYLVNSPKLGLYKGAIDNAIKDSEWLVLPGDYPQELNYTRSARIPVSDIWSASSFILSDEQLKDPDEDAVKGQIFNSYGE